MRNAALLAGIAVLVGVAVWFIVGNDAETGTAPGPTTAETSNTEAVHTPGASTIAASPFHEHQRGRGFYAAPTGTRLVFEARQTARAVIGSDKVQEVGITMKGQVALTIVERTETEIRVAWDTSNLSGTFSPAPADRSQLAALDELLHQPWQVRMGLDGSTLDAAFHPAVKGNARDMLIGLLAETRCVIAADAPRQWDSVEDDTTGRYRLHYEREDANPEGRMLVKRSFNGDGEPLVPNHPSHHVESGATIEVDTTLGWVRSVESWRRSRVEIADINTKARTTSEVSWKLLATEQIGKEALAALQFMKLEWDGLLRTAATGVEDAERTIRSVWEERMKGVQVRQLVQDLEALLAKGEEDSEAYFLAMERLSWKLRLDPAAIEAEYAALLRQASQRMQETLLMVLGACAAPEAVQLLASVLLDSGFAEATRMAALRSVFQLTQPSGPALAAVLALASDPAGSLELRMGAMLALGQMAGLQGASPTALEQLIALGATSHDVSFTLAWIEAIGNAHPAAPPAHLIELANSEDPVLREAAVSALSQCTNPAVSTVMNNLVLQDGNPGIRAIAGEFLAAQAGTTHFGSLSQVLQNDTDQSVRSRILTALAARLSNPGRTGETRPLIEWSSLHDSSAEVRSFAGGLLQ